MAKRRIGSISTELVVKSREAALCAVQIFNNPLIHFKSESFIVLMIIAWTYLLHSYYRTQKVEYRYFTLANVRRVFDRTHRGAYKYWSLETCLTTKGCPLDKDTKNNLLFLLKIRHEIEHQMTMGLDDYLGGRYQACAMNYNKYVKLLFGDKFGIDKYLTYSLQFLELSYEQISHEDSSEMIPENLQTLIFEFDSQLSEEEYNSEAYSYRLYFSKKLVNRPGQADRVVEFLDPNSTLAKSIDKEFWIKKEVERRKYLPGEIVELMRGKGFIKFSMHHHTRLWKNKGAKNPGKGFGANVAGKTWYWYERWLKAVEQHCNENRAKYT